MLCFLSLFLLPSVLFFGFVLGFLLFFVFVIWGGGTSEVMVSSRMEDWACAFPLLLKQQDAVRNIHDSRVA